MVSWQKKWKKAVEKEERQRTEHQPMHCRAEIGPTGVLSLHARCPKPRKGKSVMFVRGDWNLIGAMLNEDTVD